MPGDGARESQVWGDGDPPRAIRRGLRAGVMRLVLASVLALLAAAIPAASALASEAGGCAGGFTKETPESMVCTLHLGYVGPQLQTVVMPPGVHRLIVVAIGAPSPGSGLSADEVGRDGGTFNVLPGEELQVAVGGRGERAPETSTGVGGAGGYGGGGAGGDDNCNGCGPNAEGGSGGGGGSFVFGTAGKLLAVAGGAGGGGSPMDEGGGNGGFGGGLEGGHGNQGQLGDFNNGGSVEAYGGVGGTQSHGGAGGLYVGSKWSNGQPRASTPGVGAGPAGVYQFGQGGEGANGTPNPTAGPTTWAGGGGGGGYYGGGGGAGGYPAGPENATPSTDGGGGGGSGYVAPEANEAFNSTFRTTTNSDGEVVLNYDLGKTLITGRIDTPFDDGFGGVAVKLSGQTEAGTPVELETTTAANGTFRFNLDPGTYSVTPVPTVTPADPGEYKVEHCDGSAGVGTCTDIALAAEHEASAEFNAGYTLKGQVLGQEGHGQPGVTVLLQDTEQGALHTVQATTNEEGRFSERLAPGTVVAAAQSLGGNEFFPEPGPDCKIINTSCEVNLDRERQIGFSACVLPNPNGEALPASIPTPIPGAKTFGDLEAVGCWVPQGGQGEPTSYKSTKPVRLDGIDVVPEGGSALILNPSGPTVTSTGQAAIYMDGWKAFQPQHITLSYQGGSTASVADQGAGTGPLAPNLFGLPISLGPGGPLGYGLPFSESTGQTTLSAGLQLPRDTHAKWDFTGGVFKDAFGTTIPSLGLGGALVFTNRYGLTGNLCVSANDIDTKGFLAPLGVPDRFSDGEISGVQICYKAEKGLWEGSGMFKLPTALSGVAGDIYVKLTAQHVQPGATGLQIAGYRIQSFGLEFDHLRSGTFVYPGIASLRTSGFPLGLGFYLQSLGGEFSNNLETGAISSVTGTVGISYGPEITVGVTTPGIDVKSTELSLLRGQLAFTLVPSSPETPYWTYKLGGTLSIARLSPLELQPGSASIAYHANPGAPEADFNLKAGLVGWGVGGIFELSGQSDVPNGLLLEGSGTFKAFGGTTVDDLILNNWKLGFCALVDGQPVIGFTTDLSTPILSYEKNCNMGAFKRPKGASASAPGRLHRLTIEPHLPATMLAVHSLSGTPAVTVSGPGVHIRADAVTRPQVRDHALLFAQPAAHTLYIGVLRPHPGRWVVTALPGSPRVDSVLQATPLPGARLRATVKRAGCADEVRYRTKPAAGERELLYARQGTGHEFLGAPHAGAGRLRMKMLPAVGGRGKLIAYYLRGSTPVGAAQVASFADAAANGSERPGVPRLAHHELSWSRACAASSYKVAIARGRKSTTSHTTAPRLPFTPAGPTRVTVTALDADGRSLGSRRAAFR